MISTISCPVFRFAFSEHIRVKQKVIDSIPSDLPRVENSCVSKTDYFSNNYESYFPVFKDKFIDEIDKEFSRVNLGKWEISNLWFQIYKQEDSHPWHCHPLAHFSCVYFLDLPEAEYATKLLHPITKKQFCYPVNEGDIIIFPAFIQHCSPTIVTDKQKIVIACNINCLD